MLRRFLYLDTEALAAYVSGLEGGALTAATDRELRGGSLSGGVDAKVLRGSGERSKESELSRTLADTDESRFARLLAAAGKDAEALGWVDVLEPDSDFADMRVGMMLSWECEVFVPDIVRTLSSSGEALEAMNMMRDLLPMAASLGLDTEGLPATDELEAASRMVGSLKTALLVVGEDDTTDWRVSGQLLEPYIRADAEGRAVLVGKVSRRLSAGSSKPFVTFPGMGLVSREERRRMERTPPEPGKENEYLVGPALLVDVLAIYR